MYKDYIILKTCDVDTVDICDTAQGKDAPRANFLMFYVEYLGKYNRI